jgi:hypothetical protein
MAILINFPVADSLNDVWTSSTVGQGLWQQLGIVNDGKTALCPSSSSGTFRVKLSDSIELTHQASNVRVLFSFYKGEVGGNTRSLTLNVRDASGTIRGTATYNDISEAVNITYVLTINDAATLAEDNFSDWTLEFISGGATTGAVRNRRDVHVDYAMLEVTTDESKPVIPQSTVNGNFFIFF